jgi:hypothetical protein
VVDIRNVVGRRTDLSTFLVHLTRDFEGTSADNLEKILKDRKLLAKTPMGQGVQHLKKAGINTDFQNCITFTETPLEHVRLLVEQIEGRNCQFRPYGIAITKVEGRKRGVPPRRCSISLNIPVGRRALI